MMVVNIVHIIVAIDNPYPLNRYIHGIWIISFNKRVIEVICIAFLWKLSACKIDNTIVKIPNRDVLIIVADKYLLPSKLNPKNNVLRGLHNIIIPIEVGSKNVKANRSICEVPCNNSGFDFTVLIKGRAEIVIDPIIPSSTGANLLGFAEANVYNVWSSLKLLWGKNKEYKTFKENWSINCKIEIADPTYTNGNDSLIISIARPFMWDIDFKGKK